MILRFFHSNNIAAYISFAILLLLLGLSFLLSKGYAFRYVTKLKGDLLSIMALIHIGVSLLIGGIVPNNYLNEIDWIKKTYDKNGIWIPVTMITISIISLILIGVVLSLILTREDEKSE